MLYSPNYRSAIASRASLVLVLLAACGGEPKEAPPNVLLICWDTVRADHLTPYGYRQHPTTPFLDKLASESILFEAASATAGWTKPSVPSILTGRYPSEHGVYEGSSRRRAGAVTDILPDNAETLAEVFRGAGYATAAFVKNAQLRIGNGFEQGFDVYRDEAGDARSIRGHALDWLDGRSDERPFFLYLHFLDAHWPYNVPDEYAGLYTSLEAGAPFRSPDFRAMREAIHDGERAFPREDRQHLEALYDGALRYLDEQLARLMEELERRGLAEDLVISIVADHGEEFGEHGRIGHGHGLWENLLHVPWILRVPGRAHARVNEPVSLVDVFPTLLGASGLTPLAASSGINRLLEPHRPIAVFAEHKAPDRYLRSLRIGDRKLIRDALPTGDLHPASCPVQTGERWEAELVASEHGYRITELEPSDPDDVGDPLEWKGPACDVTPGSFRLGPMRIVYGDAVRWQTVRGTSDERLFDGRIVKARGRLADGVLVAERLKLYTLDDASGLEVRGVVGTVEENEGRLQRLWIGGSWLLADEHTAIEAEGSRRLRREDVAALLLGEEKPWSWTDQHFDLTADPEELASAIGGAQRELVEQLRALGKHLAERSFFGAGHERALDPAALADLRAIGYAE